MIDLIKIFKIDIHEANKIALQINEPHHHQYEELLIGIKGKLEHFIDFNSEIVEAPFISFVTQGKVHRIKPLLQKGFCDIWVVRFKSELIAETIFQLYSSFHDSASFSMQSNQCFERLNILCQILYDEYIQPTSDISVIRQLLTTLITIIESERIKLNITQKESRKTQNITFKNFLELLEKHYKESHNISFYATRLFMSTRNLNLVCQSILQQSVSEIIETRKLTEAKNLLITTKKTITEIGYELGFKEKTHFSHTFKKKAGVSPNDFRKEMQKLIS